MTDSSMVNSEWLTIQELHALLKEERLMASSLLIFANKQDIPGALDIDCVSQVVPPEHSLYNHLDISSRYANYLRLNLMGKLETWQKSECSRTDQVHVAERHNSCDGMSIMPICQIRQLLGCSCPGGFTPQYVQNLIKLFQLLKSSATYRIG